MESRRAIIPYLSLQFSESGRYISAMATAATYSPVRSAIILTLSFLLPLLASLYYDRVSAVFATSRFSGTSSSTPRVYNAENQNSPILAQQQSVGFIIPGRITRIVLICF
jgi:hypothetical protein